MSKNRATKRKSGAAVRSTDGLGHGTSAKRVGPVAICCMKPEYRDCLERAMDEWKKHRQELPKKVGGKRYVPGIYAFAYWLIRWSGIVKPAECPTIEVTDAAQ